jgi:membrane associated rhomboid family serine protease
MGIYDRDYYRREGPSFLGSLSSRAPVCKWLIAINVVLFIVQLSTLPRDANGLIKRVGPEIERGPFTEALDLQPDKVIQDGQVWRLLTHAFLHSPNNILHIVFNMLFLWWMGNELEEMYGSREFLTLYLTAAVFAGLCLTAQSYILQIHMWGVGASGAVSALVMLFACHWPDRKVLLFFVIPMPIWGLAVLFFGWDFIVFISGKETQTAVAAHLGGALFGFLYYRNHWRLTNLFSGFKSWKKKRAQPQLRIYREEEPTPAAVIARAPAEHEIDEHFEAKLDAVLEKMSLVGKDNLTESEKEILLKASELYRKRRN